MTSVLLRSLSTILRFSELPLSAKIVPRCLSTLEASSQTDPVELPIYAACVLARAPLLKPLPEEWEIEYQTWAQRIRARRLVAVPPQFQKAKKKPGTDEDDEVGDDQNTQQWKETPRFTEADKRGDVKSLMRCLDRYLYLIVKHRSGEWSFPKTEHQEGETIRQTGERALNECLSPDTDAFFVANWPIAHYSFIHGKLSRVEYYMKAQLLSGDVFLLAETDSLDHAWIPKSELDQYFTDTNHMELIGKALV